MIPTILLALGYLGAVGIVLFAARSAHAALLGGRAAALNPFDFAVLSGAATCLALYALSSMDMIFLVSNVASAVCNGLVALLAFRARHRPAGHAG